MAVRKDEGVYTWVQTLMATQVVDYMTLKRHLISSFQTPVQVEKEYGRLLQLHMKTGDRTIQAALDYNAEFGMHMLRAGKTEQNWPDWRYHYRQGLEQPWKEKFAMKIADEGEPKSLLEAYNWLVGIGRVVEASEGAKTTSHPTVSSSSKPQGGERQAQGSQKLPAQPEEIASRWCAWHGHCGHRTLKCSEWKRWCRGWKAAGRGFTDQQKASWLKWMEDNQRKPDQDPPPSLQQDPQHGPPPRSVRLRGGGVCHRCGQYGHMAAAYMASMPMSFGGDNRREAYAFSPPPYDPYGPPPYVPPVTPTRVEQNAPKSFAHPGSGKKPILLLRPSPPGTRVGFKTAAPGNNASNPAPVIARSVKISDETLPVSGDPDDLTIALTQDDPQGSAAHSSEEPAEFNKLTWEYFRTVGSCKVRGVGEIGLYEIDGLLANLRVRMQLDPGSSHSMLIDAWAHSHGLVVNPMVEQLRGVVIGRGSKDLLFTGYSQELHVSCEGNEARHKFLLGAFKPEDPECLIGEDLLRKLGYYIQQVRFRMPEAAHELIPQGHGADTGKDDLRTRACTPHPERDAIIRSVDKLLDEVEAVTGFCSLKEAVVEVPIPG